MRASNVAQLEFDGVSEAIVPRSPTSSAVSGHHVAPPVSHADELRTEALRPGAQKKERTTVSQSAPAAIEELLTFRQAARVFGISLRQFRRLVDAGKLRFIKVSERSPRVRPSELQRFLEASVVTYSEVQS